MLNLPKSVTVVEVGPRDGLQSFPRWVDTDVKVRMIDRLSDAGFPVIEVTNFAHPRVIPNLKDAEEVVARIKRRPGTIYRAQAPNVKGAERCAATDCDEMLGLITVSNSYLIKNQNMDRATAIQQGIRSFEIAEKAGQRFVMAIGMALWCPYEGRIPESEAIAVARAYYEGGIRRMYFAGSVGMEDPRHVNTLFRMATDAMPDVEFGWHVHNLAGMATANILAALDGGAQFIEGAICGLGGGIMMPTTMGSVGNFPSEDTVHMLNEMGVETGMDTVAVKQAALDIAAMLAIEPRSHVTHAGTRADVQNKGKSNPRAHPD
ncbi:MAG: hydroxymethylglutaryl-CoA lyase [Alphaproteobacteria bacterium]